MHHVGGDEHLEGEQQYPSERASRPLVDRPSGTCVARRLDRGQQSAYHQDADADRLDDAGDCLSNLGEGARRDQAAALLCRPGHANTVVRGHCADGALLAGSPHLMAA